MKEKYIHILSLGLVAVYGFFVAWLYWAAPKNLDEVSIKARETIENAATKGQVLTGTYSVDEAKFNEGLKAFRADNFVAARSFFENADMEKRDARTQFYIAYSFYRQGFGKVYNDDELFKRGLEQTDRVIVIDRDFVSSDDDLKMKTPAELKHEFAEGLKLTAEDFNPFKLTRERK